MALNIKLEKEFNKFKIDSKMKQNSKITLTFNSYRYKYLYRPLWLVRSALISDGFYVSNEIDNEIPIKTIFTNCVLYLSFVEK